jgi:hypothetical protein
VPWRCHRLLRGWKPVGLAWRRRPLLLVVSRWWGRGMSLRGPLWRGAIGTRVPWGRPLLLLGLMMDMVGDAGRVGGMVVGVRRLGRGEGAGE